MRIGVGAVFFLPLLGMIAVIQTFVYPAPGQTISYGAPFWYSCSRAGPARCRWTTSLPEPSDRARQGADSSPAYPDDAALVKRLLDGDEAAFNGLVEQYHGRLLRLAVVFASDRASAVTQ